LICPRARNRFHRRIKSLTLDYTPGCSFYREPRPMQIGIVAKKIGLSVDAIRFYERNGLLPATAQDTGRLSGGTAKTTLRRWLLSAAYRVWDSNSARFEGS